MTLFRWVAQTYLNRFSIASYTFDIPKRSSKQKDTQQLARSILDQVARDADPVKDEAKPN